MQRTGMAVSWYAVIVLFATALGAYIGPEKQVLEKLSCGRVWVTIHSPDIKLGDSAVLQDAIELNWDFTHCDVPKQIALFDRRPGSWDDALLTFNIYSPEGYVITNRTLGSGSLPGGWEGGVGLKGPHCLWPWVGAGTEDATSFNCLKIQPSWMEDNPEINKLRIGELMLAGTHNAGAWRFNTEINTLARDSFMLCQDRSIWAQLVHGIRYFDFRIAYYNFYSNEDDRYWVNHDVIKIRPLVPLLKEIRVFLDNTNEIVFLDAHRFPIGFYKPDGRPSSKVHQELIQLVQRELGPHLASAREFSTGAGTRGPTVQALLDADRRLLFSYVDYDIVSEHNDLWPALPHLWANTNNPSELFRYLDSAIASAPQGHALSPMHSAMAQTSPTVLDMLFLKGSLRQNADAVNHVVSQRVMTTWRQRGNIISTDFFLGNDVVDLAIMVNRQRSKEQLL